MTYIVHVSEYPFRGDAAYMYEFVGTLRDLLLELNNFEKDLSVYVEEDNPARYSNEELIAFVREADDDDGGHYHSVWCVEDKKQVM